MINFANLKNPVHTASGIAEKVLIARVDWFVEDGIKSPGDYVNVGDLVTIHETHEFVIGRGFIECKLAPEKNSYDAKSIGDTGFQKFENNVKVFFPGSYAELHDTIKELLNQPVIVLVQDVDCAWDQYYQIGSSCVYAYMGATWSTGTTKDGVKGYAVEIINSAKSVLLYNGDIPGSPDPLVAVIDGSIVGTTVTLDALESTVSGTVVYQYTIAYNDADDVQQLITLPDNSFTATFDTSILTNWNGAGFAVILTITNEWMSDTTISSDSVGQRPYHAGGFDEGFDGGFDFNY